MASKITREDLAQNYHLLRNAPEKYLAMADELIQADPENSDGYWCRHQALNRMKKHELALVDLNRVLRSDRQSVVYESRGDTLRALGRYREALDDYNRAEAANPVEWNGGFGHLFRAECHARLGDEKAALEDCAALRDDHWTPGMMGAPAGNKQQVIEEIRRLAAEARGPRPAKADNRNFKPD